MKVASYVVCILLVVTIFAPCVQGAEIKNAIINIDLQPYRTGTNSTIVNMADESTMEHEKDTVLGVLDEIEGKYYGPYLQSSLFQFAHEGGFVFFHTNFTIGSDVIMNGASAFWVRVPVIPSQYSMWHLFCDWGYYQTIEGITQSDLTFGFLLPWVEYDLSYGLVRNWGSGNVWSTTAGETYQIKYDISGIYVEYKGIFSPGQEFMLAFWGVLADRQKATVYLTQERTNTSINQTFRFYQPFEVRNDAGAIVDYGYKYDYNVTVAVEPAWAILFTSGLGKEGMTSYNLKFKDTDTDYIRWGSRSFWGVDMPYPVDGFYNDSYLSFYIPFSANTAAVDSGISVATNSIDWKVTITMGTIGPSPLPTGWCFAGLFNRSMYGLSNLTTLEFTIENTNSFLLFSTPYRVSINWTWYTLNGVSAPPPPYSIDLSIKLTPMQECDIIFMGNSISTDDAFWSVADVPHGHTLTYPYEKVGVFCEYWHENERASWDPTVPVNAHWLPLYNSMSWTDGRWAKLNETKLYWVYDFGWGIAYSFPGETQIYMFLDNGGEYFYNGSYADFIDALEDKDRTWWENLLGGTIEFIAMIAGWLWDGIMWVWDTLVSLGNWIYTTISKIVDWIVSVIKDIAGKVANIVEGMLYGMPILLIIFLVNYAGTMLYTGRIPRAGKERALFRKVIKKPLKKGYKRLKKEVVLYQKDRLKSKQDREGAKVRDYQGRLRDERSREIARIGRGEYTRRQRAVTRSGQMYSRREKYYGEHVSSREAQHKKRRRRQ